MILFLGENEMHYSIELLDEPIVVLDADTLNPKQILNFEFNIFFEAMPHPRSNPKELREQILNDLMLEFRKELEKVMYH